MYTKYVLAPSIGTLRLVKLASHGADKLGLANLTITMRELGGGGGAKTFRWTHGASRNRRQPPTRLLRTRDLLRPILDAGHEEAHRAGLGPRLAPYYSRSVAHPTRDHDCRPRNRSQCYCVTTISHI